MELLFKIKDEIDPKGEFNISNISEWSELFITEFIGLSDMELWHNGAILLKFEHILIASIIDLILGYSCNEKGIKTRGILVQIGPDEYPAHFSFDKKEVNYRMYLNNKQIEISHSEFLQFLRSYSIRSFQTLESHYPNIDKNKIYEKLKRKIFKDLGLNKN